MDEGTIYTMYYTILYYTILYYTILYYTLLYYTCIHIHTYTCIHTYRKTIQLATQPSPPPHTRYYHSNIPNWTGIGPTIRNVLFWKNWTSPLVSLPPPLVTLPPPLTTMSRGWGNSWPGIPVCVCVCVCVHAYIERECYVCICTVDCKFL